MLRNLVLLGFGLAACGLTPGGAESLGTFTWNGIAAEAGGFSGLELSEDGSSFVAIGDRATWARGEIRRDHLHIAGIDAPRLGPILSLKGPITRRDLGDSEGLALLPDGRFCVSFEGKHRIECYDDLAKPPVWRAPAFPDGVLTRGNSGVEALTVDGAGRLLAIPEASGGLTTPFTVLRLEAGEWSQVLSFPRRGNFLVTGADVGPDGRLYVLERAFSGVSFRSRVRRFEMSETALTGETTLVETTGFTHDNLEGIAVWRDARGMLRLTMISDDNFNPLQSTQFVEYALTE